MKKTAYLVHVFYNASQPVLRIFYNKKSAMKFAKQCFEEPFLNYLSFDVQYVEEVEE